MSKHTKPPWPEIDAGIVDLTIEDYEYARKCVNIHDDLVSALEWYIGTTRLCDHWQWYDERYLKASKVLSKAKDIK